MPFWCLTPLARKAECFHFWNMNLPSTKHIYQRTISCHLQIQQAEISFSVCQQGIINIFTLKSITMSSFSDYQKHEDITVKTVRLYDISNNSSNNNNNNNNNVYLLRHFCHL